MTTAHGSSEKKVAAEAAAVEAIVAEARLWQREEEVEEGMAGAKGNSSVAGVRAAWKEQQLWQKRTTSALATGGRKQRKAEEAEGRVAVGRLSRRAGEAEMEVVGSRCWSDRDRYWQHCAMRDRYWP
ncbi:hypothetical protein B296_00040990 [Ensete ventricosum]|uniref:Uncharacterized protein n=1 Tax=Ensete ventricosum TaxID=4639 RepID=A0A426ZNQ2_ENSVE|nr:hypothetical protein B296_00040990 [Ensete ventricosum]